MVCRVCLLNVKKSAVLCSECSLIAHSKCSPNAPPTCDLRSQLLLYAQYAENGNPTSAYNNPMDVFGDNLVPTSPMSDVSYVARSPRTSMDTSPPLLPPTPLLSPTSSSTPPVGFKFFKRTNSSQTQQTLGSRESPRPQKLEKGAKKSREARSLKSNSAVQNDNSLRSAGTAADSLSSSRGVRSGESEVSPSEDYRSSRVTSISGSSAHGGDGNVMQSIPGGLSGFGEPSTRRSKSKRHHETKSASNCAVQ